MKFSSRFLAGPTGSISLPQLSHSSADVITTQEVKDALQACSSLSNVLNDPHINAVSLNSHGTRQSEFSNN